MAVEEDAVAYSPGGHWLADRNGDAALLMLALASIHAADRAAQILRIEEVDVVEAQAKTPSAWAEWLSRSGGFAVRVWAIERKRDGPKEMR